MGTSASNCVRVLSHICRISLGRHDEAARMSAENLELLARVQVAWGVPYRLHSSAAPTTAVAMQTEFMMHVYTHFLCVIYK